jgi:membrane protease YdiL (CAAX protease family)
LALFFIFVFGPVAARVLRRVGRTSFDAAKNAFTALPAWYLGLTIVIVGGGEEWLYRGYAIERLRALTGSFWLAGALSLAAFVLVHVPVWGLGFSLTTLISGGIFTLLYIWQRDIVALMLAHVITDLYGLLVAPGRRREP